MVKLINNAYGRVNIFVAFIIKPRMSISGEFEYVAWLESPFKPFLLVLHVYTLI